MTDTLEMALRGIAIGALLAMGASLLRAGPTPRVRIAGLLMCLSTACYAVTASSELRSALHSAEPLIFPLSATGVGFFWLFIRVLFTDETRWSWIEAAPVAVLLVLALLGAAFRPTREVWIVHNVVEIAISAHAAYTIMRGLPGDLVAERRQLRGPFFALTCAYAIFLSLGEIYQLTVLNRDEGGLGDAMLVALVSLAGAVAFLQPRQTLLANSTQPHAPPAIPAADAAPLARLSEIIDAQKGWRREGLTIGALAEEVGVPEHRLRRLINDQLGHRNFADYLNARRIEAAKQALSEGGAASISALAFSLGFGSLGPFNRAFKAATGLTPSAWRAQQTSPNPENPR